MLESISPGTYSRQEAAARASSPRRRSRLLALSVLLLALVVSGCGGGAPATSPTATVQAPEVSATSTTTVTVQPALSPSPTSSAPRYIFYIMMENHGLNEIVGNTADAPYLNQLAGSYGIATHYFGVTHPSLPNYLAAISGSFQGIWDDCPAGASVICGPQDFSSQLTSQEAATAGSTTHLFSGRTLVDQLEAHGLTWKAYMQSLPTPGFSGGYAGLYGQKHDPFMYFAAIRNNPARLQRVVPFTQFGADLQSGAMPNFAWISPDVCNDMHGASTCSGYHALIAQGDAFIRTTVGAIMSSPAWKAGAAIVIAWDESDASNAGCCRSPTGVNGVTLGGGNVPLIVITSRSVHHLVLGGQSYNHYSLLASIEQVWGLGCLANTCGMSQGETLTQLFEP